MRTGWAAGRAAERTRSPRVDALLFSDDTNSPGSPYWEEHGLRPNKRMGLGEAFLDSPASKRSRIDFEGYTSHFTFKDKAAHMHPVYSLAISHDGSTLVSGSVDKTVKVWSLTDSCEPCCVQTLRGHSEYVSKVAVSSCGKSVFTGSFDRTACRFSPNEGTQPVFRLSHADPVRSFALDSSEDSWAFPHGDVYSTRMGEKQSVIPGMESGKTVSFSMDDQFLAFDDPAHHELKLTNIKGETACTIGKHSEISCMAWSPEGDLLLTSSLDNTVKIWQPWEGEDHHVATLNAHDDGVLSVAFSRDGTQLATGGKDERIHLYSVSQDTVQLERVLVGHTAAVTSLVFSPDGTRLFSAGFDHDIKMWGPFAHNDNHGVHRDWNLDSDIEDD